ncbi:hypothetical protein HYU95_05415 [Candidatus Daviesbacteria bacterium]|nr:hypothetical protein [Candidatus Daviesbacteria bacterium]
MLERLLGGAPIPEEQKLFSTKRALRGARGGAKFGLGAAGVTLVFGGIVDGSKFIELATNDPVGAIEVVGVVAGYLVASWGTIGAAIDSFRPTSKITTRFINDEISGFKDIGRDFYIGARRIIGK